jgi:ribosome-binding protein aMBF1 (putative translation factor)
MPRPTKDGIEIIDRLFYEGRPHRIRAAEKAVLNAEIAQCIYDLRTKAGLTQKQLAEMIGTSHSVISRLEDADYRGHSFALLHRISSALSMRMEIHFVPNRAKARRLSGSHR